MIDLRGNQNKCRSPSSQKFDAYLRNWPSAERVTSTNDSSSKRVSITEMIVVRWLFLKEKIVLDGSTSVLKCIKIRSSSSHHFKQNSCPEAPLVVDDPFAIAT